MGGVKVRVAFGLWCLVLGGSVIGILRARRDPITIVAAVIFGATLVVAGFQIIWP